MDSNDGHGQKAPKEEGLGPSNPSKHLVDNQEDTKGPNEPMDPILILEIKKRPSWLRYTLR